MTTYAWLVENVRRNRPTYIKTQTRPHVVPYEESMQTGPARSLRAEDGHYINRASRRSSSSCSSRLRYRLHCTDTVPEARLFNLWNNCRQPREHGHRMLRGLRVVSNRLPRRDKALPRQYRLLGISTTSVLREQPVPPFPLDHNPHPFNHSPRKCSNLLVPGDRRGRRRSLAFHLTSLCSQTSHGTKSAKNSPHSCGRPPHSGLHRHTIRNRLNRSHVYVDNPGQHTFVPELVDDLPFWSA